MKMIKRFEPSNNGFMDSLSYYYRMIVTEISNQWNKWVLGKKIKESSPEEVIAYCKELNFSGDAMLFGKLREYYLNELQKGNLYKAKKYSEAAAVVVLNDSKKAEVIFNLDVIRIALDKATVGKLDEAKKLADMIDVSDSDNLLVVREMYVLKKLLGESIDAEELHNKTIEITKKEFLKSCDLHAKPYKPCKEPSDAKVSELIDEFDKNYICSFKLKNGFNDCDGLEESLFKYPFDVAYDTDLSVLGDASQDELDV